jgi:hypothetical protein
VFAGEKEIKYGNWAMYFSHIRMIEPGRLPNDEGIMFSHGLHLMHINGCLFRMKPTSDFNTLKPGEAVTIPFKAGYVFLFFCCFCCCFCYGVLVSCTPTADFLCESSPIQFILRVGRGNKVPPKLRYR